jgi:hypothetical protein
MNGLRWSRRGFLGVLVATPAAVVAACSSSESNDPGSASSGGGASDGGPSGGGPSDGGTTNDAGPLDDGGRDADAGERPFECGPEYPRVDLKADCGAVGDGATNDTGALQKAAELLQRAGGGELTIPPGVYIVGEQTAKTDPGASGPFYQDADMFKVQGLACLKVSGYGATLRIAEGLRYGGFDPATGEPTDVTSGQAFAAHVGRILEIAACAEVWIEGLELDGSNEALLLGGQWGDVDKQTAAAGIWVNMCLNVTIVDVHSHHHGLDGVTVLHLDGPPEKKKPHRLVRVVSEYNGRQALSWIGGWGLECTDCKFNHTGRAINGGQPLMSAPRAGLDIEPNGGTDQISREGLFTRCEFVNNAGAGVVAAAGDGGYSTFVDCTFWGTTNYSLYVTKPGMKFSECRIHGTAVHASDGHTDADPSPNPALATSFEDCTFEDKEWTDGNVFRNNNLYTLSDGGQGVSWTRCTFINHQVRSVYTGNPDNAELFDSCTFVHSNASLSDNTYQARFLGSQLKSCRFEEAAPVASGDKTYFISVTNVVVLDPDQGDSATHVEGPNVLWNSASTGTIGDIAPGPYS